MVQFPEFMDKIVLVTGGGSGIGRCTAMSFAKEGANIAVIDVNYEAAASVAREIEQNGRKSLPVKCDVSDSNEVAQMFDQIVKHFGTLHILINCAGIIGPVVLMEEILEEEFDRTMDINLKGAFLCSKAAVPLMKKNRYGKIVNVSSTVGKKTASGAGGDYAISKAAILALTRQFAFELAPYGINVNAICPGRTITPLVSKLLEKPDHKERLREIPLGRYATPEDSANAMILLCSDRASYIVGQHVDVDGGVLLSWGDFEVYKESHKRR